MDRSATEKLYKSSVKRYNLLKQSLNYIIIIYAFLNVFLLGSFFMFDVDMAVSLIAIVITVFSLLLYYRNRYKIISMRSQLISLEESGLPYNMFRSCTFRLDSTHSINVLSCIAGPTWTLLMMTA